MNTGNGHKPNPRKEFGGSFKQENSNLSKKSTGKAFSAKKDSKSKK